MSNLNLPQINEIDSQVFKLLPKLEQININLDYQKLEINEKINELHEIIIKSKQESNFLPDVLKRLTILESLCHKGNLVLKYLNKLNVIYLFFI